MHTNQWHNVGRIFDGKAQRWSTKSADVVVAGDDCPLDGYMVDKVRPGTCFVDLGCGNGKALAKVSATWADGTAILVDLSSTMLATASGELRTAAGVRKVLIRANAGRSPLPSSCADFVILRQVLQHVPSPEGVMREAARVVRATGEVLVQVPGPGYLSAWDPFIEHQGDPIGRFSPNELQKLFASAGLEGEVSTHEFEFSFIDVSTALQFFGEISLLDKLVGYHQDASQILQALLGHPLVCGLLRSDGGSQIFVRGEYLFGRGKK
jgi:SAM-dependent methyltransferase